MCTKLIIIVLLIFTTMLCWAGEKMDIDLLFEKVLKERNVKFVKKENLVYEIQTK